MEKQKNTYLRSFKIILTILTALVATLFIVQTWNLYRFGGEDPYTTESIKHYFAPVSIPFFAWVILSIAGIFMFDEKPARPQAFLDTVTALCRLEKRLPSEFVCYTRRTYKTAYEIICGVCGMVFSAISAVVLAMLLSKDYTPKFASEFFQLHKEAEILLVASVLGVAALGVVYAGVCAIEFFRKKQLALVKQTIAEQAKQGNAIVSKQQLSKKAFALSEKQLGIIRIVFCVAGVALFIVGIYNGGMADVYEKAKNICTQCIGLG